MSCRPSKTRSRRNPQIEAVSVYGKLRKIVSEEIKAHEERDRTWLKELIRALVVDGEGVKALFEGHDRLKHEPMERRVTSLEDWRKDAQPQVERFAAAIKRVDEMPFASRPITGPPAPPIEKEVSR